MKNNKKTILITSIILGVLILTISLTYAVFSMSKTGQNSNLVVGDVYMHYANGNKSINLANVMPSETYDATSFFEFTIDGKNTTTNKDIWYEIILKHGDEVSGKTRIKDNLLKFTLTETKNGTTTTVFDGRSYGDLTNKRIWVNTINKNTTREVSITYRLYMWISNDTVIGNVNQDYTTDEWKNVFASIKVDVAGDFNEKILTTDESCFTTETIKAYQVNSNMTTEELNKCTTYFTNLNWTWNDGETPEAFCKGTGTNGGGDTFQSILDNNWFSSDQLSYFENNNIIISSGFVTKIIDYDATCGTDVVIPSTINGYPVTIIGNNGGTTVDDLVGSFEKKNLLSLVLSDSVTTIESNAFKDNQLTSIVIPNSVVSIGSSTFKNNQLVSAILSNNIRYISTETFTNNKLTNIIIPNSVKKIGFLSFKNNQLTSIEIPSNVTIIDSGAFSDNQLTSIEIPNNVTEIGLGAFQNNQLARVIFEEPSELEVIEAATFNNNNIISVTIPDSVTTLYCDAFDNTVSIIKNDNLVCTVSTEG